MSGTAVAEAEAPQATRTAQQASFGPKFVVAASFGSVLNPVNSSIIAVALVSIGRAFGVGADSTAWLVAALYLATVIGQPTMGRLADLAGRGRCTWPGRCWSASAASSATWRTACRPW